MNCSAILLAVIGVSNYDADAQAALALAKASAQVRVVAVAKSELIVRPVIAAPAPVKPGVNQHSHYCPHCKITWVHNDEFRDKVRKTQAHEDAHHCPKCGLLIWQVHEEGPKMRVAAPTMYVAPYCPT